jgi:hypothetical protein
MDVEFDSPAAHGLYGYLRQLAGELGLSGESWFVQWEPPVSAYLALDDRIPLFPGRDVALVWDEERGWAAAIETYSGEDLVVLSYAGKDVLPAPSVVARFARGLIDGELPGSPQPVILRTSTEHDDLEARLTAYIPADIIAPAG